MSEVIQTLEAMEAALADDDYERVRTLSGELFDAYDEQEAQERAQIERAKAVSRRTPGDVDDAVSSYLTEAQTANLNRLGASLSVGVLVPNPGAGDQDLRAHVSEMRKQEEAVAEAAEAAAPSLDDVSLPAMPRLVSVSASADPVPLSETVELTLGVANVGDEAANGLTLSATGDGLTVTRGDRSLDLGAGARRTVTFDAEATETGDATVTFELSAGEDVLATDRLDVEVLDKVGYLDRAERRLEQLRTRIAETGLSKGRRRSLTAKVDAASDSLGRARDEAADGREKQANNQLNAATKQLGALVNALEARKSGGKGKASEGKGGKSKGSKNNDKNTGDSSAATDLSERERVGLVATAEELVELLATARSAAL